MIKIFRTIRQKLLAESRFNRYMIYAIGEILLVVIGILIALQINNWNEARKTRVNEINYLKNLKADLIKELENNVSFETFRFGKASSSSFLLNTPCPKTIAEAKTYTDQYVSVFMWDTYVPNNNTFLELLSSGNLSLISNDSIKNDLLQLDKQYARIATVEEHMRREFEHYLYDVSIKNIAILSFADMSSPTYGLPDRLRIEDIPGSQHEKMIEDAYWLCNHETFNNGLKLALMNNGYLANMHKDLTAYIRNVIRNMDEEIAK